MHRPRSSMCFWQLNNLNIYFSLVCLNFFLSVCMSRFGYVFQALKFQPIIKIMPQNFQEMILEDYTVHQECHRWPCHPLLHSGTLNVLQVPPFLTHFLLRYHREIFRVSVTLVGTSIEWLCQAIIIIIIYIIIIIINIPINTLLIAISWRWSSS